MRFLGCLGSAQVTIMMLVVAKIGISLPLNDSLVAEYVHVVYLPSKGKVDGFSG